MPRAKKAANAAPESIPTGQRATKLRLNAQQFCKMVGEYPHRGALQVYVYRSWPKIQSDDKVLDKVAADDFSLEWLTRQWGSGEYLLFLHDSNRRPEAEVARASVTIREMDFPPNIDVGDLILDHKDNAAFIREPKIREELRARGLLPGGPAAMGDAASVLAGVVRDVTRQQQQQGGGQGREMDMAVRLATLLQPKSDPVELAIKIAALNQPKEDSGLIAAVLKQNTELTQLVLKAQAPPAAAEGGSFSTIKEVLSLLGAIGVKVGPGGGGGGGSWVHELIRALPEFLPQTLEHVSSMVHDVAVLRAPAAAAAAAAAVPNGARRRTTPASSAPGSAAAAPGGALPAGNTPLPENFPERGGRPAVGADPWAGIYGGGDLNQSTLTALVLRALDAWEQTAAGSAFAASLTVGSPSGQKLYLQVTQVEPDEVLRQIMASPLKARIEKGGLESFREFLDDFYQYGEDPEDSGGDGAPVGGDAA